MSAGKINMWKWLLCTLYGHEYYVIQAFTNYSRRLGCSCCDQTFAMNDDVKALIAWDDDIEQMYKSHGHVIWSP